MENKTLAPTKPLNLEKPVFSMLVKPVVSNREILTAWQAYQELKQKLLSTDDFAEINGQEFPKKSAYRKLALAFGVSVEIIEEKRIAVDEKVFAYEMTAKATSPNGRSMTAVGSTHSNERRFSKASDIRAIAQTRATNRAISDLLGGVLGVSADEMMSENDNGNDNEVNACEPFTYEEPEEETEDNPDKAFLDHIFPDQKEPVDNSQKATDKQINLIIKLVESNYRNENDRSHYLREIEARTLSKTKASQYISQLLAR